LLLVISHAATDNQISQKESEVIRERWEELKTVTESFVHACEVGSFGTITQAAVAKKNL
jgi:hypothetical protein